MSDKGDAYKNIFEYHLNNEKGITVTIYKNWNSNKMSSIESRAVKQVDNFELSLETEIDIGDVIQPLNSRSFWKVVDIDEHFQEQTMIKFIAKVIKIDKLGNEIAVNSEGKAVFHAPIYGGVQIGGQNNSQKNDVQFPKNQEIEVTIPSPKTEAEFEVTYFAYEFMSVNCENSTILRLLRRKHNPTDEVTAIIAKFQSPLTNSHDIDVKAFITVKNLNDEKQVFIHKGVWLNDSNVETKLKIGGFVELVLIISQYGRLRLCEPEYLQTESFDSTRWINGNSVNIDVELVGRFEGKIVFKKKFACATVKFRNG